MSIVIQIVSIFVISTLVHLFGTFWALRLAGIKTENIQIFYGRPIYTYWSKYGKFEFGYIPGGSIKYDVEEFSKRGIMTRILLCISGPLSILLSSIFIISFIPSIMEFMYGFKQIFSGSLFPVKVGVKLVDNCIIMLQSHNYLYGYAVFSTKIAAFNLLPIGPLNGGHVISEFFEKIKLKVAFQNIGFIFVLIMIIDWVYIILYRL